MALTGSAINFRPHLQASYGHKWRYVVNLIFLFFVRRGRFILVMLVKCRYVRFFFFFGNHQFSITKYESASTQHIDNNIYYTEVGKIILYVGRQLALFFCSNRCVHLVINFFFLLPRNPSPTAECFLPDRKNAWNFQHLVPQYQVEKITYYE